MSARLPVPVMQGRVCVVTGGTSGIGLETARGLARLGATVIVTGRSAENARAVAGSLAEETGAPVRGLGADFSSLAEVRALAERISNEHRAIHVLVNNAGLWHPKRELSRDGYEDTIAVNHLAPFLLTRSLRDALVAGAPSRVITVSSRLHAKEKAFDFDDPMSERRYHGLAAYRQSKLANVMFANELARRLEGTGVTSNSLHPGDVPTKVTRESPFVTFVLTRVASVFLASAAQAAGTSIHLASAPELAPVTGRYFRECREAEPAAASRDEAACARLWAWSEELVAG